MNHQLAPRGKPQQARSRATYDHITKTSLLLLEEVGIEGFNTNLLAQRAGMSQRAIYRYFPNKLSILVELSSGLHILERQWIGNLQVVQPGSDWRDYVNDAIDGYFEAASKWPGFAALRSASQAVPELRALDELESKKIEADLSIGLRALGISVTPKKLETLCRLITETTNRIMDVALLGEKPTSKLLVDELKRMLINLLADYIPNEVAPQI